MAAASPMAAPRSAGLPAIACDRRATSPRANPAAAVAQPLVSIVLPAATRSSHARPQKGQVTVGTVSTAFPAMSGRLVIFDIGEALVLGRRAFESAARAGLPVD